MRQTIWPFRYRVFVQCCKKELTVSKMRWLVEFRHGFSKKFHDVCELYCSGICVVSATWIPWQAAPKMRVLNKNCIVRSGHGETPMDCYCGTILSIAASCGHVQPLSTSLFLFLFSQWSVGTARQKSTKPLCSILQQTYYSTYNINILMLNYNRTQKSPC